MRKPSPLRSSTMEERKRGPTPCCTKVGLKRGPWTPEEDEVLASFVRREGESRWRTLPKRAGLPRCGKSCRLRWMNYLRPSIKHGSISPDEEDLILRLHRLLGNRWSLIAGRIPGRTDNEIKNYWNTYLSKKLISQGIDPRTHKPLEANNLNKPLSDLKFKAPAPPVTAPVPYPNPNVTRKFAVSVVEEMDGSSRGVTLHEDHSNYFGGMDLDRDEAWRNYDGLVNMGLQGSHGGDYNEDEGVDCSTEDGLSSFLDSLINEDFFLQQNHQQQNLDNTVCKNNNNNSNHNEPTDPSISSQPGFALGALREAGLTSTVTIDEDVHEQFEDHAGKHP